jgi:hypothetical protein
MAGPKPKNDDTSLDSIRNPRPGDVVGTLRVISVNSRFVSYGNGQFCLKVTRKQWRADAAKEIAKEPTP